MGSSRRSVARYLHVSTRAGQPFVELDCAQGTAEEIEAALLGTGRDRDPASSRPSAPRPRCWLRGAARSSSIISSDLPATAQRRLARILRDGEVRTSGRERVRMVARIVAAATPSLVSDARDGRFRADLLRRFAGQPITLPPLACGRRMSPAIVQHLAADIAASAAQAGRRRSRSRH